MTPPGTSTAATPVAVWAAPPVGLGGDDGCLGPGGRIGNRSIRMIIYPSGSGDRLRIRVSNRYGTEPCRIGSATVAPAADGADLAGVAVSLSFGGCTGIEIPPGKEVDSDWALHPCEAGRPLAVSLFVTGPAVPATYHKIALQHGWLSAPGDHTRSTGDQYTHRIDCRVLLTAMHATGGPLRGAVVAFGDSITDGTGSTPNANHRYPDFLARRVAAHTSGAFSVVNAGIAGNSLLRDGLYGEAGTNRFTRDVLGVPGVTAAVVLIGVNDIGFGQLHGAPVTAKALIAGYRRLIATARRRGVAIVGGTITPFRSPTLAQFWSRDAEHVRSTVNEWILQAGEFDAVADFASGVQDGDAPERLSSLLDSGDGVHPNDEGYRLIAHVVPIDEVVVRAR